MELFHAWLTSCRTQAGMTQTALAAKLGVSAARVSEWENRKLPSRSAFLRLCDALRVDILSYRAGELLLDRALLESSEGADET